MYIETKDLNTLIELIEEFSNNPSFLLDEFNKIDKITIRKSQNNIETNSLEKESFLYKLNNDSIKYLKGTYPKIVKSEIKKFYENGTMEPIDGFILKQSIKTIIEDYFKKRIFDLDYSCSRIDYNVEEISGFTKNALLGYFEILNKPFYGFIIYDKDVLEKKYAVLYLKNSSFEIYIPKYGNKKYIKDLEVFDFDLCKVYFDLVSHFCDEILFFKNDEEIEEFFNNIEKTETDPLILSITKEIKEKYF